MNEYIISTLPYVLKRIYYIYTPKVKSADA